MRCPSCGDPPAAISLDWVRIFASRASRTAAARRRWLIAPIFVIATLLTACAEQRLHSTTGELLQQGNYEAAVDVLDAGERAYPNNVQLQADAIQARRQALIVLLQEADAARRAQRFDDAQ